VPGKHRPRIEERHHVRVLEHPVRGGAGHDVAEDAHRGKCGLRCG